MGARTPFSERRRSSGESCMGSTSTRWRKGEEGGSWLSQSGTRTLRMTPQTLGRPRHERAARPPASSEQGAHPVVPGRTASPNLERRTSCASPSSKSNSFDASTPCHAPSSPSRSRRPARAAIRMMSGSLPLLIEIVPCSCTRAAPSHSRRSRKPKLFRRLRAAIRPCPRMRSNRTQAREALQRWLASLPPNPPLAEGETEDSRPATQRDRVQAAIHQIDGTRESGGG
jgi:hypothetical protein